MAATATVERAPAHGHSGSEAPSIVSVGTIVWLSSELMFFSALFSMYFTMRASRTGPWPPPDVHLNVPFSATFTIILVLSSVTCQMGVFAAERGNVYAMRRWLMLTFVMGAFFIGGQTYEYFVENDFTLSTHGYGSVYYITTGFHYMHVCGGLVAFIVVLSRSWFGRFTPEKASSAIVVSYYWHFVDVVWIALYATIYLIR